MPKTFKVFDTPTLYRLAEAGWERGYNRQASKVWLDEYIDPDGKHVIAFTMMHEHIAGEVSEPHVRALILAKLKGLNDAQQIQLDMSFNDYNALPEKAAVRV